MFTELEKIYQKPPIFSHYTADLLWNDPYISGRMLAFHLNENIDVASRKSAFIDSSVSWISRHFNIGPESSILDFGCGPGLYTNALALRGARVTGLDFSKSSLEYASQTAQASNLNVRYVLGDYLQFETDARFDLIALIMCDFCALNPGQRKTLLRKIHTLLNEGGSFLFDVYSLKAFEKKREGSAFERRLMDGFWSPEDYFGFTNVFTYPSERVSLDKYVIVERRREWEVYNWLQYYSLGSLEKELDACGLKIIEKFADVAGSPFQKDGDEFAVTVRRQ